ncbi:hypothetical protein Pcinc_010853 [Petrolisthes cinctipes]|uniref:Uncharacterized protein n=1 Tax=Petrolisthes cinctipes TaxID=88211 RepID=A0AAE1G238_PETCI|nr:hypothetical protein Pcinc_010853 [Petrolisthes cinctipes]
MLTRQANGRGVAVMVRQVRGRCEAAETEAGAGPAGQAVETLKGLLVTRNVISPTSTSSERNWSLIFGNTHTKLCNRLTNDRVEKLVAVRSKLKLFEPGDQSATTAREDLVNEQMVEEDEDTCHTSSDTDGADYEESDEEMVIGL